MTHSVDDVGLLESLLADPADPACLEFSKDAMLAMGRSVLTRAADHIANIADAPVRGDVETAAAEDYCRSMREPAPALGTPLDGVLASLFEEWVPRSFTTTSPGYLAYIPGGGLFPAALADFIAGTTNRFTGIWQAAPALVQLEANALSWIRDWMGFPDSARGLFTTGGSMSNFTAMICARERHLGTEIRSGTLYASAHVHHCVAKSARLAGIMPDRLREIPVDKDFRMIPSALESAIAEDRRSGRTPFFVVSSAGTTNTGAVDPLETIGNICKREGLWHHVDGAYGGFFHMVEELRPLLAGLSEADSLTLDPHKGLFLPYGTGALLVRDGAALRAAHAASAGYLPHMSETGEFYDPSQYGPDLSRGFPGLRVWLAVKLYGTERLKAAVLEKRRLALWAAEEIARIPSIRMVAPPQLSLFAFELDAPGLTRELRNRATEALLENVTRRGRVMMTGCTVDGRFLGRVCVLSFRTKRKDIETCVEQLREAAREVLGGG